MMTKKRVAVKRMMRKREMMSRGIGHMHTGGVLRSIISIEISYIFPGF